MSEGRSVSMEPSPPLKPAKATFPVAIRPPTGDSDVAGWQSQFFVPYSSTMHTQAGSKYLLRQLLSSSPGEDQPGGQGEGAAGGHVIPSRSHQKPTFSAVPESRSPTIARMPPPQGTSSNHFSRLRGLYRGFEVLYTEFKNKSPTQFPELVLKKLFPESGN